MKIKKISIIILVVFCALLLCGCKENKENKPNFSCKWDIQSTYKKTLAIVQYDAECYVSVKSFECEVVEDDTDFADISISFLISVVKYKNESNVDLGVSFNVYLYDSTGKLIDQDKIRINEYEAQSLGSFTKSIDFWEIPNVKETYTIKVEMN